MKLRWFQFHLSTMVLLSLAAGGLLWLTVNRQDYVIEGVSERDNESELFFSTVPAYGWPLKFMYHRMTGWIKFEKTFEVWALAADIGIALAMLSAVAVISEKFLIKRRE